MGKIVRGKKVSRCSALYPTLYTQRADRFEKKRGGREEREKMQDETKTKHNGEGGKMGRRMIVVV